MKFALNYFRCEFQQYIDSTQYVINVHFKLLLTLKCTFNSICCIEYYISLDLIFISISELFI